MTTQQLNIFDKITGTNVPVKVPDFHGDFVAEMDYIVSLSTEERQNYLEFSHTCEKEGGQNDQSKD